MASVRPMQSELNSQMARDRQRGWIPASVWQRQGMSAQEMTLPLDVVIPTNSPDRASIVLKAGQKVMVLKSPKGIYMQLENGKIIAIRTAFKVGKDGNKEGGAKKGEGGGMRGGRNARGGMPNQGYQQQGYYNQGYQNQPQLPQYGPNTQYNQYPPYKYTPPAQNYPYGFNEPGPSSVGQPYQYDPNNASYDPMKPDDSKKSTFDKAEMEKKIFEQWDKEEGIGQHHQVQQSQTLHQNQSTCVDKENEEVKDDKKEDDKKEGENKKGEDKKSNKEEPGIPYDWATELLKGYVPGDINASGKMAIFFCILEESIALGDRILVFSQSLFTLNLIEELLQQHIVLGKQERWMKNVNYYRLDGSTTAIEREKLINEFNSNPNLHLFLVSTRAGSLGINLVGANRVIVFDASWNPCHDTQAVCRVYR
uniref:Helicase C-terminal domain-containing protein n=1 Tax=Rhodnius prolixus TaxID=13249 RepID=T1HE03_RHOPR